jgi:hypothetical protein
VAYFHSGAYSVAIGASGTIYSVAGNGGKTLLSYTWTMNAPLSFAPTAVGATSSDSPAIVTLENDGDANLVPPPPTTGTNASIAAGFTLGNGGTCPQRGPNSSPYVLAAGASCTYQVRFAPMSAGTKNGSLVLTDNNLNVVGSTQSVALTGTITPTITTTPTATTITYGNILSSSLLRGGVASITGNFAWTMPTTVSVTPCSTTAFTCTLLRMNWAHGTRSFEISLNIRPAIHSAVDAHRRNARLSVGSQTEESGIVVLSIKTVDRDEICTRHKASKRHARRLSDRIAPSSGAFDSR